jgi:hypothetical protein
VTRLFFLQAKHIIGRFEGFFVGCAVHFFAESELFCPYTMLLCS